MTDQDIKKMAKMADVGGGADRTESTLTSLFHQVVLTRATQLARAGFYEKADYLISEMVRADGGRATHETLDLLARIRVQQGRLREAEIYWSEALKLDPKNQTYQAALGRLAKKQSRPMWFAPAVSLMVGLFAILMFALVGVSMMSFLSGMRTDISKLEAALENVKQQPAPAASKPDIDLELPGISTKEEEGDLYVIFQARMFSYGIDLMPEAKTVLKSLGEKLGDHAGSISVQVIGHTDNVPLPPGRMYRDNTELGMARAAAVVEYLRRNTKLPASMFSVASLGESSPPHPNDTDENRCKNRTVVLRISAGRQFEPGRCSP